MSSLKDQPISLLGSLSLSELNSFLMDLYRERINTRSLAQVLEQFESNRFVQPSDIDPILIHETELSWLTIAKSMGFDPLLLSPLAPLGSSSLLGHVDQNNIISAIRSTEVVSDATNVLALLLSVDWKKNAGSSTTRKLSTVHRHVRGQSFDNPKLSAHFSTFCLVSGGIDRGNYAFELDNLEDHLNIVYNILTNHWSDDQLILKFYLKKDSEEFIKKLRSVHDKIWTKKECEFVNDKDHEYYTLIQFKVFVKSDNQEYTIADGGIVDWTQKLLQNKKHRCMISGIGIELLHRI